jgi:glycosyltransferase involved in cell wall biosynthesis
MDDGSTDQTTPIVQRFATKYPFIHVSSAGSREGRNFGSQYKALQAAYALARPLAFDFVGVHDADIAPERGDYYQTILEEFDRNPRLGIAGGFIYERMNWQWQCRQGNSEDSVAGGIQMVRRSCFDQIGGYVPLYYGGSDSLALLDARMAGWAVFARPDLHVFHYRPTSSAGGKWRGIWREGFERASFGSHPVYEFFRCCHRLTHRPFMLGSAVRYCAYLWWNLTGRRPLMPAEKVAFLRSGQMAKLRGWVWPLGGRLGSRAAMPRHSLKHDAR